jgi:sec-independent protein translocase protein TatA
LFGLGLPEIVVIGGVAALLFGPSKLPELGKSLGKTVKSFQSAANEFNEELKKEVDEQKPKGEEEPKKEEE